MNRGKGNTNSPELVISFVIILPSQPFQAGVQIFFIMAFLRNTLFSQLGCFGLDIDILHK